MSCLQIIESNHHQEVERLSKELSEERKKKEELSNKVGDLVTTNTTLQQLVGTTQEALDKENTVVKSIQEQVTNNKVRFHAMWYLLKC